MKTHDTIVCGWDVNKKLMFMRTFYYENSETEKKLALEAYDYAKKNCPGGCSMSDIEVINVVEANNDSQLPF